MCTGALGSLFSYIATNFAIAIREQQAEAVDFISLIIQAIGMGSASASSAYFFTWREILCSASKMFENRSGHLALRRTTPILLYGYAGCAASREW